MSATGERAARRSSQSGTTLIEALVVVAITSALALIGFPRLERSFLVLSERQAAAQVAEALRLARAQARRTDQPVGFAVTDGGRAFAATGLPEMRVLPGATISVVRGVHGQIVFYADGSSSGGQVLVRAAAITTAINVVPRSGVVWVVAA